jgi:NAD(P)-dependent dehydrogenase (short-subunit alcohol dehydrogenase family)
MWTPSRPVVRRRRRGEPGDIVRAVLFFAGPASSFVTGQTLSVDGGWIPALVH